MSMIGRYQGQIKLDKKQFEYLTQLQGHVNTLREDCEEGVNRDEEKADINYRKDKLLFIMHQYGNEYDNAISEPFDNDLKKFDNDNIDSLIKKDIQALAKFQEESEGQIPALQLPQVSRLHAGSIKTEEGLFQNIKIDTNRLNELNSTSTPNSRMNIYNCASSLEDTVNIYFHSQGNYLEKLTAEITKDLPNPTPADFDKIIDPETVKYLEEYKQQLGEGAARKKVEEMQKHIKQAQDKFNSFINGVDDKLQEQNNPHEQFLIGDTK